jgi:hypothetical protein
MGERKGKERKGKEWGKTLLNLILPLDLIAWKKGEKSAVRDPGIWNGSDRVTESSFPSDITNLRLIFIPSKNSSSKELQ